MDGRDFSSGAICFQARYLRISKQGHMIVSQRRHDTADVRVRFCVNKTGEAVTCVATDAWTFLRIFLIQHDPEWSVKWLQPVQRKVVAQLLNARFVADRWVWGMLRCDAAQSDLRQLRRAHDKCVRPRRSTAPARCTRWARPVRPRRNVLSRQNPLLGDGTAPRHKTWCCHRRNNWCVDAARCRPRCAKVLSCCSDHVHSPPRNSNFLSRAEQMARARAVEFSCRSERGGTPKCRRPHPNR